VPKLPWDELGACFVVAWVVVMVVRRLSYGVDFRDEAFYAAITQRFALGDVPFVDEINLRATGSLFATPFYWVFVKLTGSTDGIILFLRKVYVAVELGVAVCAYRLAILHVGRAHALLVAAAAAAYVPFSIPALSYNTVAASLLAAGVCIGLRGLALDARRSLIVAGVVHGLACVAYPPLALICLVLVGGMWVSAPGETSRERRRPLLAYLLGQGGVGALAALTLGPPLLTSLGAIMAYEGQLTQPRSLKKALDLVEQLDRFSPATPSTFLTVAVLWLLARQSLRARRFVLPFAVLAIASAFREGSPTEKIVWASNLSIFIPLYLGLFALVLVALVPAQQVGEGGARAGVRRQLFFVGVLPSLVAGSLMAFSSDAGFGNANLGYFAASLVALVALPLAVQGDSAAPLPAPARAFTFAAMAAVPYFMVSTFAVGVYWDGAVSAHTTQVRSGPFASLYTLPAKAQRAEEVNQAIRALVKPGDSFVSFYDFPAGYLSVPVKPGMPTSWADQRAAYQGPQLDYYRRRRDGKGYALVLTGTKARDAALDALVAVPARLVRDGGWYRIYREPPP
jgi:hypothetical protein